MTMFLNSNTFLYAHIRLSVIVIAVAMFAASDMMLPVAFADVAGSETGCSSAEVQKINDQLSVLKEEYDLLSEQLKAVQKGYRQRLDFGFYRPNDPRASDLWKSLADQRTMVIKEMEDIARRAMSLMEVRFKLVGGTCCPFPFEETLAGDIYKEVVADIELWRSNQAAIAEALRQNPLNAAARLAKQRSEAQALRALREAIAAQKAAETPCPKGGAVTPPDCPAKATINPADLTRQTSNELLANLKRFSDPRAPQYNPHNVRLIREELLRGRAALNRQLAGLDRSAFSSDAEFQRAGADIQREINEINEGLNSTQVRDALKRCAPCPTPLTAAENARIASARRAATEARAKFFGKAAEGMHTNRVNVFAEFNREITPLREAMLAADRELAAAIAAAEQTAARQAAIAARAYEIETRLLGGAAARGAARTAGRAVVGALFRGAGIFLSAVLSSPVIIAYEMKEAYKAYVERQMQLEDAVAAGLALNSMRTHYNNVAAKIIQYWKEYLDALDAEAAKNLCGAAPIGASQARSDQLLRQLLTYAGQLEAYDATYKITAILKFEKEASAFMQQRDLNALVRQMFYDTVTPEWRIPAPWLADRDISEENKRRDSAGNYYYVFRTTVIPGGRQALQDILDAVDEKIYLTLFAGGGGSMIAINEYMRDRVIPAVMFGTVGCFEHERECECEDCDEARPSPGDGGGGGGDGSGWDITGEDVCNFPIIEYEDWGERRHDPKGSLSGSVGYCIGAVQCCAMARCAPGPYANVWGLRLRNGRVVRIWGCQGLPRELPPGACRQPEFTALEMNALCNESEQEWSPALRARLAALEQAANIALTGSSSGDAGSATARGGDTRSGKPLDFQFSTFSVTKFAARLAVAGLLAER